MVNGCAFGSPHARILYPLSSHAAVDRIVRGGIWKGRGEFDVQCPGGGRSRRRRGGLLLPETTCFARNQHGRWSGVRIGLSEWVLAAGRSTDDNAARPSIWPTDKTHASPIFHRK